MAQPTALNTGKHTFRDLLRHCNEVPSSHQIHADTNVLTGRFSNQRYRSGVSIHAADILEEQDLDVEFNAEPRLTLCVLFEGELAFSVDGRRYHLEANEQNGCQAFALTCNGEQAVCRHIRQGRRVKKLSISVHKEWLEVEAQHSALMKRVLNGYFMAENRCVIWQPSATMVNLATQISQPPPATPALRVLQQEYHAIELMNASVQEFLLRQYQTPQSRLEKAVAYIEAHSHAPLNLSHVANHAGVSISTLQRLFKAELGKTVVQFIREQKLRKAQQWLLEGKMSIGEAAFSAGYQHVSNFVTAYKNTFGVTPGDERARFLLGNDEQNVGEN